MRTFLKNLQYPYVIVPVTFILSFFSWIIASHFAPIKAFSENMPIQGFYIPFLWGLWCYIIIFLSFSVGIKVIFKDLFLDIKSDVFYYFISILAWLGVFSSFYKILTLLGIEGIITMMVGFALNEVKETLYEEYSVGILSLRYLIIVSAGLALWRLFFKKSIWDYVNLIIFIVYSFIYGRRLDIICMFFFFLIFYSNDKTLPRINIKSILIYILVILTVFIAISSLRNFNHYDSLGVYNPINATFFNALAYLSAPTQAMISIGVNLQTFDLIPEFATNYLGLFYKASDNYTTYFFINYSKIYSEYNANSALLSILAEYGWLGLILYGVKLGFWSIVAGISWRNNTSVLFILYPMLLYAFAEIWRLDLFSGGIFYTIIGSISILCITVTTVKRISIKK